MVKKKKSLDLLTGFLTDKLHVTTKLKSTVQLNDGEFAEVPLILEGFLLDFDEDFIMMGQTETDGLELVARDSIAFIKQVVPEEQVMNDPNRPPREEMS